MHKEDPKDFLKTLQPMGQIFYVEDIAGAALDLLQGVFGKDKSPCRLVYGIASLPLGAPVELEVIFEVV